MVSLLFQVIDVYGRIVVRKLKIAQQKINSLLIIVLNESRMRLDERGICIMANIAVFVPREQMLIQTQKVIEEEGLDIFQLKVIETANAVYEARDAVENGAEIIVARGLQAKMIKQYTNIPVVEITFTGQELGLLVQKAKQVIKKKRPFIAFVGFRNMFSNMSHFEQLYDIQLGLYYIQSTDKIQSTVAKAVQDGAEIIIGGDTTTRTASNMGVHSLFLDCTEDSIRDGLHVACKMGYAADLEKYNNAQLETILNTSFNGIIKINTRREIIVINKVVEDILARKTEDVAGTPIEKVLSEIDTEYIDDILEGRRESYSTSIRFKETTLMIVAAPIQYDNKITGAILSCHKAVNMLKLENQVKREMYLYGYIAKYDFGKISRRTKEMKQNIELAKLFSLSQNPVLIYGDTGTEKEIFAQCIHNHSTRSNGPFVSINCGSMNEEMQIKTIFGSSDFNDEHTGVKGAMETANFGTVYIQEIEHLSPQCQYRLYKAIKYKGLIQNDIEKSKTLDVRVIADSKKNLAHFVKNGLFREDLYYSLSALSLEIPPLKKRPEDVEYLVSEYIKKYMELYSRYIVIPKDTYDVLKNYPWEGNLIQLENFCDRLVLTADKRTVDAGCVENLLHQMYPIIREKDGEDKIIIFKHPEAVEIADTLDKYKNRAEAAGALGISTTTLWRRMKKYGLQNKYEV